ncbi:MAG: hypothetical protein WAX07_05750 [Candidatus Altiarchaeia archaeon]|jgi:hypothetical protein
MAKTVFKGRGTLISGTCPRCPEMVSVFLREDEAYKNSRCNYCGTDIYGDGISGIIREGHHVSLIPPKGGRDDSVHETAICPPEILEYDKKRQEDLQEMDRQHLIFEIPHRILKRTKREMSG